jgi:Ca2+-binding RTX toxin-like protein
LLDYEQAQSHAIMVRVTDASGHALDKQIVIDLTNVAEPRLRDGTTAADVITVDTSDDWTINGLAGNDAITTRGGTDTIRGGAGDDKIVSAAGNDLFLFSGKTEGFDMIDGGDGNDRILAQSAGTTIGLRSLAGVEKISANGFTGVTISGGASADVLDFRTVVLEDIGRISGGAGNDVITGSSATDLIAGGLGNDTLDGAGGDDSFLIGKNEGFDAINGGAGNDSVLALSAGTVIGVSSVSGVEVISANGFGSVTISGTTANDIIDLASILLQGIQQISGGSGNDRIMGSAQDNVIAGNAGADQLWGNGGADIFKFGWIGDSRSGGTGIDLIQDFEKGLDRIDLTGIDASTKLSGNQAFTFIGGAAFGKVAGQIRVDSSSQSATIITGDVNGDGVADFRIDLAGFHQLAASDFLL